MSEQRERVLDLLGQLVEIPSAYPPGDTSRLCARLAELLTGWGYGVRTLSCAPGIDNLVAALGSGSPCLVYNCHLDTMAVTKTEEWQSDPYTVDVRDGRVYGLGVNNCKGPAAAQLWAAEQIARAGGPGTGSVVFTFVGDEEALGPGGTAFLRREAHIRPDMLIVGAPTGNEIIVRERGVTWIELTVRGRTAHAGTPADGDNAIMRAARLLVHLEKHLLPALNDRNDDGLQSTLNVGTIRGGSNINVVPSECVVAIDRRVLPEKENIKAARQELRKVLAGAGEPEGSWELRHLAGTNGFAAPKDGPLVSGLARAIEVVTGRKAKLADTVGAFDGRYFADDGIEIVDFGPGEDNEGPKSNESLPLDQLNAAARIYRDTAFNVLGRKPV